MGIRVAFATSAAVINVNFMSSTIGAGGRRCHPAKFSF